MRDRMSATMTSYASHTLAEQGEERQRSVIARHTGAK